MCNKQTLHKLWHNRGIQGPQEFRKKEAPILIFPPSVTKSVASLKIFVAIVVVVVVVYYILSRLL